MTETSSPTEAVLEVENLTVRMPAARGRDGVEVLRGIDLVLHPGELMALVGPSGAGKSTVLRALACSLPAGSRARGSATLHLPDGRGAVSVLDQDPEPRRSGVRRTPPLAGRAIAYVPQSPMTSLSPLRTVGWQLRETIRALGSPQLPPELAVRVGLPENALHCYPHELSGGMAQRACVALALAGDPVLLLADEPTSALDPELTGLLLSVLRDHADAGGAGLVVTHDVDSLVDGRDVDTVTFLARGTVEACGSVDRVLGRAQHPAVREFLTLPAAGHPAPTRPTSALPEARP